jgi:hypothetical protein
MIKNLLIVFSLVAICACDRDDASPSACKGLVDGVYAFPELPENHGMTQEEVSRYWDLPEEVAGCISGNGLINTILDYPHIGLIMASSSSPQHGYDTYIRARFRGVRELENRPDRGTDLLLAYQQVDPLGYDPAWELLEIGRYQFRIFNLEIVFSQYNNLAALTLCEKIKLMHLARAVFEQKRQDEETYGVWGLATTAALMARLMKLDEFPAFMAVYDSQEVMLLTERFQPLSIEVLEDIYTFSESYLDHLIRSS